jgi:hypothetical protein
MHRFAPLCATLLCACSFPGPPTLLPPPFGPNPANPEPARFFFPTGVAIAAQCPSGPSSCGPAQWLIVSNSNADRQYDTGAMYSFRIADLLPLFERDPALGPQTIDFPIGALAGKAMTGNYTGPMVVVGACTAGQQCTSYTGSRDTNRLNAIEVDPASGALSCRTGATVDTGNEDCRSGAVDLGRTATVEGPFGITTATLVDPNSGNPVPAVLVNSTVPHIDDIQSGVLYTSSRVAAVNQSDPTDVLLSAPVTTRISGGGVGGGPIVFDDRRREVIVAGCYVRFGSASAGGEPSTLKCGNLGNTSILRFVPIDAGSSASTRVYDLSSQLHAIDVTGLAIGDVDATTGMRALWASMRSPDAIARIGLPADPAFPPIVQSVATMSTFPSLVQRLQRPPGSTGNDLLVVSGVATYETSTTAGKLIVFDGTFNRVITQVEGLGDTPFAIAQFPPQPGDLKARLAVTDFGSCRVSLIEVPYDTPELSVLRASVGSCPQ